jgi:hypothetical protein
VYFQLTTEGPDDRATIGVYPELPLSFSWVGGRRFEAPPPVPLRFEVFRDGGARMPAFFVPTIPLMRHDLLVALRQSGVDNLDDYPAEVFIPQTGVETHDYRAVNVVGVVKAADLAQSSFSAPSGRPTIDVDFDSLVLDESLVADRLLFRLAEAVSAILVHDKVRRAVEPLQFDMLRFRPISEAVI